VKQPEGLPNNIPGLTAPVLIIQVILKSAKVVKKQLFELLIFGDTHLS
jgi:hypothetical protein